MITINHNSHGHYRYASHNCVDYVGCKSNVRKNVPDKVPFQSVISLFHIKLDIHTPMIPAIVFVKENECLGGYHSDIIDQPFFEQKHFGCHL